MNVKDRVWKKIITLVKEADSCLICQPQQSMTHKIPWFLQGRKKEEKKNVHFIGKEKPSPITG